MLTATSSSTQSLDLFWSHSSERAEEWLLGSGIDKDFSIWFDSNSQGPDLIQFQIQYQSLIISQGKKKQNTAFFSLSLSE